MSQIDIPDFDRLISGNGTPGNMGDTGAVFTAKINGNFALIKVTEQQIDAILTEMAAKMLTFITAGAIKSLNVTTSGILQYSTDGVSYTDCIQWGKIRGSITNQSDLRTLLDEKASIVTVSALESLVTGLRADVNTNTENIASNLAAIQENTQDITEINVDLTTINNQLALRPLGNGIRQFRISGGRLQYSLSDPSVPNPTWVTVTADVTVTWQTITGDPMDNSSLAALLIEKADQSDLEELESQLSLLTPRITTLENLIGNTNVQQIAQDLATHVADTNNPHQVTKAQVGLENVDNTSDANKPLSAAQQQYIDNEISGVEDDIQDVDTRISDHINDTGNPHSVTKAQIGLDKVDNTADFDKPISRLTDDELKGKISGNQQTYLFILNQAQYDALSTKMNTAIYLIDDTLSLWDLSYAYLYFRYEGVNYKSDFTINAGVPAEDEPIIDIDGMTIHTYVIQTINYSIYLEDPTTHVRYVSGSTIPYGTYEVYIQITNDSLFAPGTMMLGTITGASSY